MEKIKKYGYILLVTLLIVIIIGLSLISPKAEVNKIKEITLKEAYELVEKGSKFIDVRTLEEYNEGHIKGSINIEYDQIDKNRVKYLPKKIIVYCKSGARSKKAAEKLSKIGFTVYDLGGIDNLDVELEKGDANVAG